MSEIDDAAVYAPPEGVVWIVWEGWDFLPGEDIRDNDQSRSVWPSTIELVDTRAGKLADHFHMNIWIDEPHVATLYFEVLSPDRVQLAGVMARDDNDVEEVLSRLTAMRPMSWWRTVAVRWALMTSSTQHAIRKQGLTESPPIRAAQELRRLSEPDRQAMRELLSRAGEIAPARHRGRITPELLTEVARVYREAFAAGRPPTEAVAQRFDKPRSTAGRWVAQARRTGALGPADGPRAGEASDV